jgi:hypothetical protein
LGGQCGPTLTARFLTLIWEDFLLV